MCIEQLESGMLIDTHCHLFMDPLYSDVEGVLRRARYSAAEVPLRRGRVRNRIPNLIVMPGIFGYAIAGMVLNHITEKTRNIQ